MPSDRNSSIDLREFVKSENERLYNFCLTLLEDETLAEDVLLETFEKFVRKEARRSRRDWADSTGLRITLYRAAWEHAERALMNRTYSIERGRDTRGMNGLTHDLLASVERSPDLAWKRLFLVEPEFRAPMVLKDLLGFEDDEAMEILGIRWGVYRHRLHRGRMAFLEHLTGKSQVEPVSLEAH